MQASSGMGIDVPTFGDRLHVFCESCTVQAQIGMELRPGGKHLALLTLEWMRIIDQANACSQETHQNYQSFLRKLHRFETSYGVTLLQSTPLPHPPRHPSIRVMWAQQQYTLQAQKGMLWRKIWDEYPRENK
jgi:hypothetical protein